MGGGGTRRGGILSVWWGIMRGWAVGARAARRCGRNGRLRRFGGESVAPRAALGRCRGASRAPPLIAQRTRSGLGGACSSTGRRSRRRSSRRLRCAPRRSSCAADTPRSERTAGGGWVSVRPLRRCGSGVTQAARTRREERAAGKHEVHEGDSPTAATRRRGEGGEAAAQVFCGPGRGGARSLGRCAPAVAPDGERQDGVEQVLSELGYAAAGPGGTQGQDSRWDDKTELRRRRCRMQSPAGSCIAATVDDGCRITV